jgi:hypothetical protein
MTARDALLAMIVSLVATVNPTAAPNDKLAPTQGSIGAPSRFSSSSPAINNHGEVVGVAAAGSDHPLFWSERTGFIRLFGEAVGSRADSRGLFVFDQDPVQMELPPGDAIRLLLDIRKPPPTRSGPPVAVTMMFVSIEKECRLTAASTVRLRGDGITVSLPGRVDRKKSPEGCIDVFLGLLSRDAALNAAALPAFYIEFDNRVIVLSEQQMDRIRDGIVKATLDP